jgi:hypothetical protein
MVMKLEELLGFATGVALAPAAAVGSLLRQGRIFHPEGVVCRAQVTPATTSQGAVDVAAKLAGPAMVRLSGALWRREMRPDILGAAIRFRSDNSLNTKPGPDDQDLLFATIPAIPLLGLSLLTTQVHSYLWDDYYAIGIFEAAELGRIKLRLASPRVPPGTASRDESLDSAIANGRAVFDLQARLARVGSRYEPIARIELTARVDVDQEALRFSPFRNGRGIVPRGFINAARIAPYAASQAVRPER